MHQNLKDLRRRLREEHCPASVLQRVYRQVSLQRAYRNQRYLRLVSFAVAALILIGLWSFPLMHSPHRRSPAQVPAPTLEQHHAVRMQAGLALAYIGRALNRAGDESRDIILEASLPPLRQSLRTAGEIISNPENRSNKTPEDSNS